MDVAEALAVKIYNGTSQLPTHAERRAVREEIFDEVRELENRIDAVENSMDEVSEIIEGLT